MPKYIALEAHLTTEAMERRYREAKDVVARSQWQILWLLAGGKRSREVALVTGYSLDWIRKLVKRYNTEGPGAVGDGRHSNPGRERLLSAELEAELREELVRAEANGQSWSSVEVAVWMSQKLGREVRQNRGWDTLQRVGFSTKTPRPRHAKADEQAQEVFKKSSA
jgi:transposase